MIIDELLNSVKNELRNRRVSDLRIGLSYTGVLLDDNGFGVSFSFREEVTKGCEVLENAGDLGVNALKMAELALSNSAVDSSVGVATMNAVINKYALGEEGPILDFIDIRDGDRIGMVGNFKPIVNKIREDVELYIFERGPCEDDRVYPDWAAEQILPSVDISMITGTAVVNKTIDRLIQLSKDAREIIILGPTTPMAPNIFRKYGVTYLGGMIVEDTGKALKIISQGGGSKKLGEISRKISIHL